VMRAAFWIAAALMFGYGGLQVAEATISPM
jgi:hypothetical protein